MNLEEYEKIKDLSYGEYCTYLQNKYGIGKYNYMTKSWNKNTRCTRTKEGLIAHHRFEDRAIMLSNKEYAKRNPFEWQLAENIIFCDYLEHLMLHVLICEQPSRDKNENEEVGIGGIINFIVPELNDFYSGWISSQKWQTNCHNIIKDDKSVYLIIVKRFKNTCNKNPFYTKNCLYKSFNEKYNLWTSKQNKSIYDEIKFL